jgi:hypothetical protein
MRTHAYTHRYVCKKLCNNLLTDGLYIRHPRAFAVYIVIMSSVNIVPAMFYSVVRLVCVLFTLGVYILRLDRSIFPPGYATGGPTSPLDWQ